MRLFSLRSVIAWSAVSALLVLPGCDFGTLESLSQDQAADAPTEVSVAARSFWLGYSDQEADVAKLTADIENILQRAGGTNLQAKISNLQAGDTTNVGLGMNNAPIAAGMLLVSEITCTLEDIEKLVIATNQDKLYPDTYDAYKRTYLTSEPDYLSRKTEEVKWQTDLTASLLSRQYESLLNGGNHYFKAAGPGGKPMFFSRTFLTKPATFLKNGEGADFNQDYQIELYWERTPGHTAHFYAVWREFKMGTITSDSALYQSLVLGNLADFDKRTGLICQNKSPAATFD
jgi:hypothetical protein